MIQAQILADLINSDPDAAVILLKNEPCQWCSAENIYIVFADYSMVVINNNAQVTTCIKASHLIKSLESLTGSSMREIERLACGIQSVIKIHDGNQYREELNAVLTMIKCRLFDDKECYAYAFASAFEQGDREELFYNHEFYHISKHGLIDCRHFVLFNDASLVVINEDDRTVEVLTGVTFMNILMHTHPFTDAEVIRFSKVTDTAH